MALPTSKIARQTYYAALYYGDRDYILEMSDVPCCNKNVFLTARAKMSLCRAQNTFMPANINSIVLLVNNNDFPAF